MRPEHYAMFFVEREGTASSFRGMAEVIDRSRPMCLPQEAVPDFIPHRCRSVKSDRDESPLRLP